MSSVAKKIIQTSGGNTGSGKTMALVSGASYFTVVDISDASNMSILGSVSDSRFATSTEGFADVDTDYNLFFASNSSGDIVVGNFSDPTNPTFVATHNLSSGGITRNARTVVLDTSRKFIFTNFNNHDAIYRHTYSSQGSSLSNSDIAYSSSMLDNSWGMAVDTTNEILYSANYSDRSVTSIDYSSSSAITVLQEKTSSSGLPSPQGIAVDVDNSLVYAAGGPYHMGSLGVSNPSSMSLARSYNAGSYSVGVSNPHSVVLDLEDEVALVYARGNAAVAALDITIGNTITVLGSYANSTLFDTAFNQIQVDTERKILFVICPGSGKGLTAIDYSDPTNLSLIGNISHASLRGRRLALA